MKSVSTSDIYIYTICLWTDLWKGPKQCYGITADIFGLSKHQEQEPNQG